MADLYIGSETCGLGGQISQLGTGGGGVEDLRVDVTRPNTWRETLIPTEVLQEHVETQRPHRCGTCWMRHEHEWEAKDCCAHAWLMDRISSHYVDTPDLTFDQIGQIPILLRQGFTFQDIRQILRAGYKKIDTDYLRCRRQLMREIGLTNRAQWQRWQAEQREKRGNDEA